MEYYPCMDPNKRLCPICNQTIDYKNAKILQKAIANNRPCVNCKYKNRKNPQEIKCPLCDFVTKKTTIFDKHLLSSHNTTAQLLWDQKFGGPKKCRCGCGGATKWLGWDKGYSDLLIGHNAKLSALYDAQKIEEILTKRKEKTKGKTGWSNGLTKDSDDRVKKRSKAAGEGRKKAFAEGKIKIWSKGFTKESDERLMKLSELLKDKFSKGILKPWARGLSKEKDEKIKDMASKVSLTHQNINIRKKLDDLKRLKAAEIKERVEANGKLKLIEESLNEYVNDNTPNIIVECITCGTRTTGTFRRLKYGRCYTCDPGGSITQHEISNWIKSLDVNVDTNRRDVINGLEIDIYVPEKKLGIEYNGLYWHSVLHKSTTYHDNKTQMCTNSGINLFHVFEDEWRDKRLIVESMIKHKLGLSSAKISARKCAIVQLSNKQRRIFFEENHIDGDTSAKFSYGLMHGEKIVSAISLRTPFHKKHENKLEVARFCSLLGTSVVGGLSKLTNHVAKKAKIDGYQSIMSYVDTRLGYHNSWTKAGWTLDSETSPRFWWTDFSNRYNRFKFKASSDKNLTEAEVADQANVVKIWGCRNLNYKIDI